MSPPYHSGAYAISIGSQLMRRTTGFRTRIQLQYASNPTRYTSVRPDARGPVSIVRHVDEAVKGDCRIGRRGVE